MDVEGAVPIAEKAAFVRPVHHHVAAVAAAAAAVYLNFGVAAAEAKPLRPEWARTLGWPPQTF